MSKNACFERRKGITLQGRIFALPLPFMQVNMIQTIPDSSTTRQKETLPNKKAVNISCQELPLLRDKGRRRDRGCNCALQQV